MQDVVIERIGESEEFDVIPQEDGPPEPIRVRWVEGQLVGESLVGITSTQLRVGRVGPHTYILFAEGERGTDAFVSYGSTVGISLPLPTETVLAPAELATGVRVRQETAEGYLYQFQTAAQAGGPWTNVGAPLPGGPVIEQFFELPPGQKFHRFEVTLRPVTPAP